MITPREIANRPAPIVAGEQHDIAARTVAGTVSPTIDATKPISRSATTPTVTATIDQVRLCRVVLGAPRKAKGEHQERERVDRRQDAVMKLGAELPRLLP